MKKLIPAVFFQKQLDREKQPHSVEATVKKPLVLDLYENEMRDIVGGRSLSLARGSLSASSLRLDGPPDGAGGVTTFSGSEGWLDVAQADDCGM